MDQISIIQPLITREILPDLAGINTCFNGKSVMHLKGMQGFDAIRQANQNSLCVMEWKGGGRYLITA